ncbi:MAG: putative DNA binding domain-containing protein [Bacteroidota bacterium]|nr:putative DNA binding domain-containing protein [Bacteroidota bacterium]MDE2834529.1 putative DNA binding domain-containing protein [Bacteroidota bacterium]
MRYSSEEVQNWMNLGEDSTREFKQIRLAGKRLVGPKPDDLADEIAAFANALGGHLLCGVRDDGTVEGLSRGEIARLSSVIGQISSDKITPPLRLLTHHGKVDGKQLLIVEIPRGVALHKSPNGYYVRSAESKRRLNSSEQLRLAQQREQARFRWFDEQVVPETGFETLQPSLWKPLLSAQGAEDPELALRKLAILTDDESGICRATVAGILLCTEHPEQWLPGARITATRYHGTDRASGQADSQDITGPLNRQIIEALAFAIRNMQVAARKAPARVDLPQYSGQALFEAIVNAVVHRDYSMKSSRIFLRMFSDRLEIQSPGSLPNNLTVESMSERQATRNEVLASLLGRMRVGDTPIPQEREFYLERRGDGVPIIRRETYGLSGRNPKYRLIDESELRLTIPSAVLDQSPAQVVITVCNADLPIPDAELLVLFPNKTWIRSTSNQHGEARVKLHSTHLPMTVLVAAPGHTAHVERDWRPDQRALTVDLDELTGGGAVIFPEATGNIPGLRGRLNPILDSLERCYLYAFNISVNDGTPQPVQFVPGEYMHLTDADGRRLSIRVGAIVGRAALVEYQPYFPPPK